MRTHHMCPLEACRETWLLYWNAGCSLDNTGSCEGSGKIGKARQGPCTPGPDVACQSVRTRCPHAPPNNCLPVLPPLHSHGPGPFIPTLGKIISDRMSEGTGQRCQAQDLLYKQHSQCPFAECLRARHQGRTLQTIAD